jgi:hypothetical protein
MANLKDDCDAHIRQIYTRRKETIERQVQEISP